ncbi:MAG: hypothetical protein ACRCUY_05740 [Thermoguttaceae bacterium]
MNEQTHFGMDRTISSRQMTLGDPSEWNCAQWQEKETNQSDMCGRIVARMPDLSGGASYSLQSPTKTSSWCSLFTAVYHIVPFWRPKYRKNLVAYSKHQNFDENNSSFDESSSSFDENSSSFDENSSSYHLSHKTSKRFLHTRLTLVVLGGIFLIAGTILTGRVCLRSAKTVSEVAVSEVAVSEKEGGTNQVVAETASKPAETAATPAPVVKPVETAAKPAAPAPTPVPVVKPVETAVKPAAPAPTPAPAATPAPVVKPVETAAKPAAPAPTPAPAAKPVETEVSPWERAANDSYSPWTKKLSPESEQIAQQEAEPKSNNTPEDAQGVSMTPMTPIPSYVSNAPATIPYTRTIPVNQPTIVPPASIGMSGQALSMPIYPASETIHSATAIPIPVPNYSAASNVSHSVSHPVPPPAYFINSATVPQTPNYQSNQAMTQQPIAVAQSPDYRTQSVATLPNGYHLASPALQINDVNPGFSTTNSGNPTNNNNNNNNNNNLATSNGYYPPNGYSSQGTINRGVNNSSQFPVPATYPSSDVYQPSLPPGGAGSVGNTNAPIPTARMIPNYSTHGNAMPLGRVF